MQILYKYMFTIANKYTITIAMHYYTSKSGQIQVQCKYNVNAMQILYELISALNIVARLTTMLQGLQHCCKAYNFVIYKPSNIIIHVS